MSSTHCLAMCGGISASVGGSRGIWLPLLFNLGRVASYTLVGGAMGSLTGYLGQQILEPFNLPDLAVISRGLLGVLMAALALHFLGWLPALRKIEHLGVPIWRRLAPLTKRLLPANTANRALMLGMLWGYLPCGLTYTLLLAATISARGTDGAILMLGFGLGTLPAMIGASWAGYRLRQWSQRQQIRQLGGALLLVTALWTVAGPWVPHFIHDPQSHPSHPTGTSL